MNQRSSLLQPQFPIIITSFKKIMISKSFVWYILFKLKICVTRKFEKTLKEIEKRLYKKIELMI
nr:MAG TPA: hypothetical protein [Caudoviricetes sp.]